MDATVAALVSSIQQGRALFKAAQDDDQALAALMCIDGYQRKLHFMTGKYLPMNDGKVWAYDVDKERWLEVKQ